MNGWQDGMNGNENDPKSSCFPDFADRLGANLIF